MKRFLVMSAVLLGVLSGCASTPNHPSIEVRVDALNNGATVTNTSYYLVPADNAISAQDLTFIEFARIVERALAAKNYERTQNKDEAQLLITLGYGVRGPNETQYSYSTPQYGQVGGTLLYRSGDVISVAPSYGIVGYSNETGLRISYQRIVQIAAFDKQSTLAKEHSQLWKVDIISDGQSDDLRWTFPYLIQAASPYLGEHTEKKIRVNININDPSVHMLRDEHSTNSQPIMSTTSSQKP